MAHADSGDNKAALRAKWKHQVRRRPLAERFAWLKGEEGLAAFGARQRWEKLAHIHAEILFHSRQVPSAPWLDDIEHRAAAFPVPGMVLSRGLVRIGGDVVPTRRYTPALIASIEDMLDAMDALRAAHYRHPPSITGLQMELIGWRKGREEREKLKAKKLRKPPTSRNKRKIFTSRVLDVAYDDQRVSIVAQ